MTIDGVYYTEPELAAKVREMKATIDRLESENYKLTEKLEEIGTAFNEQVSLNGWYEERIKDLIAELEKASKPVKSGRWVWNSQPEFGNPYGSYNCSVCGSKQAYRENYCPDCGTQMEDEP